LVTTKPFTPPEPDFAPFSKVQQRTPKDHLNLFRRAPSPRTHFDRLHRKNDRSPQRRSFNGRLLRFFCKFAPLSSALVPSNLLQTPTGARPRNAGFAAAIFLHFFASFFLFAMESHEILQRYSVAKTSRILMMFKGGLSQNIVVDLGSLLQNRLGFDVKVRRMFGIFVELAQNVKNYSAETELGQDGVPVGIGILMLSEGEHHYSVNSGNLVRKADAPRLREECEYIKGLDKTIRRILKSQKC
jgi:hypothetical protein